MKIAIGNDHAGYNLKLIVKQYLINKGYEIIDVGTDSTDSVDYPVFGYEAAKKVASGEATKGIVICYSGIGISIAANKVKGIRCANATELEQVELTRKHNDANMLGLGAHFVNETQALKLVDMFLNTEFEGGRHARRVGLLDEGAK